MSGQPVLLGVWLGIAFALQAIADPLDDGLARLAKTCQPDFKNGELVVVTEVVPSPVFLQNWPFIPLREEQETLGWLFRERDSNAILVLNGCLPLPVTLSVRNDDGTQERPRIRYSKIDPEASTQAIIKYLKDEDLSEDPRRDGAALLHASLLAANGHANQGRALAEHVLATFDSARVPVAWALSLAANAQYTRHILDFPTTGDLRKFTAGNEILATRFTGSWPARQAVLQLNQDIEERLSSPEANLDVLPAEARDVAKGLSSHTPSFEEIAWLADAQERFWLFEYSPYKNPSGSPLADLTAKGPDAIRLLSTLITSKAPTHYIGSVHGGLRFDSLESNPLAEGYTDDLDRELEHLLKPLTLGDIARYLLRPIVAPSDEETLSDADLQAAAADWLQKYGNLRDVELLQAILETADEHSRFALINTALASPDDKWLAVLTVYFAKEKPGFQALNTVSAMTQVYGSKSKDLARAFLSRFTSDQDVYPEYLDNADENTKAMIRKQVEEQIALIRKAAK